MNTKLLLFDLVEGHAAFELERVKVILDRLERSESTSNINVFGASGEGLSAVLSAVVSSALQSLPP